MKNKYLVFLILLLPVLLALKCGPDSPESCLKVPQSELFPCSKSMFSVIRSGISSKTIFNNTQQIVISRYLYPANAEQFPIFGNTIEVVGDSTIENMGAAIDCCTLFKYIDKFPDEPILKWDVFQSKLVAAAIFKNEVKLSLDGKRIQNIEDIVWTWNSGMGTGSQSGGKVIVEYKDGKDVLHGQTLASLTKLNKNSAYFWAVWAWDELGKDVIYSSRAIPFIVERLPIIEIKSIFQLEGKWKLNTAIDREDGSNFTSNFKIQEFIGYIYENDDFCELRYTTKPQNSMGSIQGSKFNNEFLIEDILLYNFELTCDNELIGISYYNNRYYNIKFFKF